MACLWRYRVRLQAQSLLASRLDNLRQMLQNLTQQRWNKQEIAERVSGDLALTRDAAKGMLDGVKELLADQPKLEELAKKAREEGGNMLQDLGHAKGEVCNPTCRVPLAAICRISHSPFSPTSQSPFLPVRIPVPHP